MLFVHQFIKLAVISVSFAIVCAGRSVFLLDLYGMTLCGHGHVDCACRAEDGRVDMEIHCDAYKTNNGGSPFAREYGTVSEIAMDVVIVDRDTGRIQTVRYGAGESHVFS